jgi:hypothetical protein
MAKARGFPRNPNERDVAQLASMCGVGVEHPAWRGGRTVRRDGYIGTYVGNKKYDMEHIKIAESALGRPMPKGAEVHHVDGDRQQVCAACRAEIHRERKAKLAAT